MYIFIQWKIYCHMIFPLKLLYFTKEGPNNKWIFWNSLWFPLPQFFMNK